MRRSRRSRRTSRTTREARSRFGAAESRCDALAEHDVRRVAGAEVDAPELGPAVLRIEAARLARARLGREQDAVVRLARQQLREQRAPDAAPLLCGAHVQLDDLVVRRLGPLRALRRGQAALDAVGPPLAGAPRVAVAEADDLVAFPGDEEDEVPAPGVRRQARRSPLVRKRAGAERRAVRLPQLGHERQRIDFLDRQLRSVSSLRAVSRSTTTWVTGSAKRSRALSTTPRSSQCERPTGCVEITSSSGRKVRTASSIAWIGSPSPISPSASSPTARIDPRLSSSRPCAFARAPSSSETQWRSGELSAGHTTSTRVRRPAERSRISDRSSGPPTVSFATTRIR